MSRVASNLHVDGTLTAKKMVPAANNVEASHLTATLATGQIQLPLVDWRELVSADIDTAATGAAKGSGGILAKDTTPILERVNVGTDPMLRIKWAAGNTDAITMSVVSPVDLDEAKVVTVKLRAKMSGATDTPTVTVDMREDVGGANIGGATGALSNTLATVSKTVTATASTTTLKAWTLTFTPGTHATDAVELYAAWLEYSRK